MPGPGPVPPANPTRQLLDELDALMQRMLALPVNQLEDKLRPTTPEGDSENAPDAETNRGLKAEDQEGPVSRPSSPVPDWERPIPASPEVLEAIGRGRAEGKPAAGKVGGVAFRPVVRVASPAAELAVEVPLLLRPLVWCNRAFDSLTLWLGPAGRWLRSPAGRSWLGWIGLGLLAGATAWALVNEFGWTW
jgi:hypothetical protein